MTEQEPYGLMLSFKVGNSIFEHVIYSSTDDRTEILNEDQQALMMVTNNCEVNIFTGEDLKQKTVIGHILLSPGSNNWHFQAADSKFKQLEMSIPDIGPEPIIELERKIFTKYWETK